MKKLLISMVSAIFVYSSVAVVAEPVDTYYMKNDVLYVNGSGVAQQTVSALMTQKDDSSVNGAYLFSEKFGGGYAGLERASDKGLYQFVIPVKTSGAYTLLVTCGGAGETITFKQPADKDTLVKDMPDKELQTIALELKEYALSLELQDLKNDEYYLAIATEIVGNEEVKSVGFSKLAELVAIAEGKIDFFAELKDSILWAQINALVQKYDYLLHIDLSDYENLESPDVVDLQFVGKTYNDIGVFVKDYVAAIAAQKQAELDADDTDSNGTGGGFVGGGGFGGGSVFTPLDEEEKPELPESSDLHNNDSIETVFEDMTDVSWATEAVKVLQKRGAINGIDEKHFNPNGNIKREEFVKIACIAFGYQAQGKANFIDVVSDRWYAPYIAALADVGIVKGSDGKFGVGENITRQDAAVLLTRIAEKRKTLSAGKLSFADNEKIAEYATEDVAKLVGSGVINGKENNCFDPVGNLTRAEGAKMIYELLQYLEVI